MDAPTITDGQEPDPVTLRPLHRDDTDDVFEMCSDPQMQRWTTVPVPYLREHASAFIDARPAQWADDSSWTLAIEARDDDGRTRYAGNLSLRPNGVGAAEVGFALAPWARGRGVMSRALREALAWGFTDRERGGGGLTVVQWQAHVGNWDSRRVAWATGFRIEGTVRGLCASRGQLFDGWIGTITRGEAMHPATTWLSVPELRGAKVVLRPWRADDVPRVAEACADAECQRWLPQLPAPYTLADAQWYVGSREEQHAAGEGVYWCVADAADDRCVGSLGLMRLTGADPSPEIGYWAHPDARGRGRTTEALSLAVRHAVVDVEEGGLGLKRVTLRAAATNAASNAVATRAGMTRTGLARRAERLRDGTVDDFVLYDVLADEVAAR